MECLLSIFADNFFQKTKWISQKLKLETWQNQQNNFQYWEVKNTPKRYIALNLKKAIFLKSSY